MCAHNCPDGCYDQDDDDNACVRAYISRLWADDWSSVDEVEDDWQSEL